MLIVASLVVATAVSGFISLAGGVVAVWVGLNVMEASVSHAVRFVVGVGIVIGDLSRLMVVAGGSKCQDVLLCPIAVGVIMAVQKVGGGISGTSRRIFRLAHSHLTRK